MMKQAMQKAALTAALLLVFQQGAMASEGTAVTHQAPANNTAELVYSVTMQQDTQAMPFQISQEEFAAVFESATSEQRMQIAALDDAEMQQTQGAFWWFFVPLVVRAMPAVISFAAGTGGTMTIPMWSNRFRVWW